MTSQANPGTPVVRADGETPLAPEIAADVSERLRAAPPPRRPMDRFIVSGRKKQEPLGHSAGEFALAALLMVAAFLALVRFPDHLFEILGGVTVVVGSGKLVAAQFRARENDDLPPASAAFRALADPKRPLTADDPVTLTPAPPERMALAPSREPADPVPGA